MITLKKREKIMAIAAGAVGVLLVGYLLFVAGDPRLRDDLRKECKKAREAVEEQRRKMDAAEKAVARLTDWQRRSLPADLGSARSLYQDWLHGIADRAKFTQVKVTSSAGAAPKSKVYTPFIFTLRGRATLEQLTRFLNDFYRAGHFTRLANSTSSGSTVPASWKWQ